ncbi:hypothetical protein DFR37_104266 [Eoetvoesiella caeni]|uniref:Uncharacterized protein n=1 Tax=Eoetvoesiella caeni TaxID=645616 RepID=A0A366HDR3_9BURK|nr:hypothetical protein DFR37_104266 [Eoetvoesiella caeni]
MPMIPSSPHRDPTFDDTMDTICRNILKHKQRSYWLTKTGHVCSVTDAWAAFKRSPTHPNNRSP